MTTAVILLVCATIALHSCKGYDGVIPVNAEEEEEEESMCAEIVRQMYESIPWSALSHKSVREALHTLTEFVTSREARSLVRTFILDVWSEREDEDDVDFLNSFLHFLSTASPEATVQQATRKILTFLQTSLQENYDTDLAQTPQYDEDFLENIDNFIEQNDVFNKEEQYKDDYKEYREQVIERNGILKRQDFHKILRHKTFDQNSVVEDTPAANIMATAWTHTSSSTQPAITTTNNLLLNKIMNHSPKINEINRSSDMEIIIKLKDKPVGQINVEVKKNKEDDTPEATQMNMHAKVTTLGNVGIKQAKDISKEENVTGTPQVRRKEEDITSNLEERRAKVEQVTPPPTCPLVTEVERPGAIAVSEPSITHETRTSNQSSVEQSPCEAQELKLQEWEKVAFLSLIRAIILKEKYKICQSISEKISQNTLPPTTREISNTTDQENSALINITLPNLRTEYSVNVIPNYASVSPLSETQSNKSMSTIVTSIRPDSLKVNNTPDLNSYMNFFSKLIYHISDDSVTPSHPEITTGVNDQPSQWNSTEHVPSSTSAPSIARDISDSTPHVTTQFKTEFNVNVPVQPFMTIAPQPSSNIAVEKMNREDVVSQMDSSGPFIANMEPVLTSGPSKEAKAETASQERIILPPFFIMD